MASALLYCVCRSVYDLVNIESGREVATLMHSSQAIKKATPMGGFCMSDGMVPVHVITVGRSMPVRCLISAKSLMALIISARAIWGSWLRLPVLGT